MCKYQYVSYEIRQTNHRSVVKYSLCCPVKRQFYLFPVPGLEEQERSLRWTSWRSKGKTLDMLIPSAVSPRWEISESAWSKQRQNLKWKVLGFIPCWVIIESMMCVYLLFTFTQFKSYSFYTHRTFPTQDQYHFLHKALVESLMLSSSAMSASNFLAVYKELLAYDEEARCLGIKREFEVTFFICTNKM